MKNGRLYECNTGDETCPDKRKLIKDEWKYEKSVGNTSVKE
jgi:hypothetical protein